MKVCAHNIYDQLDEQEIKIQLPIQSEICSKLAASYIISEQNDRPIIEIIRQFGNNYRPINRYSSGPNHLTRLWAGGRGEGRLLGSTADFGVSYPVSP